MRTDEQRLDDVLAAAAAIESHLERKTLADSPVFDPVRVRLIEIGEAVKDIDPGLLANERDISWVDVARMRDLSGTAVLRGIRRSEQTLSLARWSQLSGLHGRMRGIAAQLLVSSRGQCSIGLVTPTS